MNQAGKEKVKAEWRKILPNAQTLDLIRRLAVSYPSDWVDDRTVDDRRDDAKAATEDLMRADPNYTSYSDARHALWEEIKHQIADPDDYDFCSMIKDALSAVLTYPEYVDLINVHPDQVRVMSLLGNNAATLMYPACLACTAMRQKTLAHMLKYK